jgi:serine/threonine-protein kinase
MQAGEKLSHYRIIGEIGAGGMGVVYRAQDVRLGRAVALKVLSPRLAADPTARRRFEHEARAASSLDHPNICALYDVGETPEGGLFLALAFCEGETLRQELERGPLETRRALAIALQIADGLGEAHAKAIVHRDIKPANVMLRPDGVVKILDFGVARVELDAALTGPSDTVGSPAYMAPEQILNAGIGPAADLWALGVVLFEMLTGRRPFEGGIHAVLTKVLRVPAPSLLALRPDLDPALGRLVARTLAKDPQARHRSTRELADELRSIAPDTAERSFAASVARSAATSAHAAGASAPAASSTHATALPTSNLAVLPFSDLSPGGDQAWFCDGLAEELITALSAVRGLRVASRASTLELRQDDPRTIGRKLRVETLLTGSVRRSGDRLRITTQLVRAQDGSVLASSRYDRDLEDIFAVQDAIASSVVETVKSRFGELGSAPRVRRPTESVEAYNLYLKGRYHWNRRTPTGFRDAIRFFQQAVAIDPELALGYVGMADAHSMLAFFGVAEARESAVLAKELCLRALELDHDSPEARTALATIHARSEWDWERAERGLLGVISASPQHADARHALSIYVLTPLARFEEAIEQIGDALALDPLSLVFNTTLGLVLYMARRFDEAERQLRATLEIDEGFPPALVALAETLGQLGRDDEAVRLLQARPAEAIENRGFLGAHLARAGRVDEARAILDQLVDSESGGGVSKMLAAQIHTCLGESEKALDLLEQCAAERSARLIWIGVRPLLDPLRDAPRFQRILDRLRLPNVGRANDGRG